MFGGIPERRGIAQFALDKICCFGYMDTLAVKTGKSSATSKSVLRLSHDRISCFAIRLRLEFSPSSAEAQEMQKQLVEKHMCICWHVVDGSGQSGMLTLAPSEPLLAQAARYLMDRPSALGSCLRYVTFWRRQGWKRAIEG